MKESFMPQTAVFLLPIHKWDGLTGHETPSYLQTRWPKAKLTFITQTQNFPSMNVTSTFLKYTLHLVSYPCDFSVGNFVAIRWVIFHQLLSLSQWFFTTADQQQLPGWWSLTYELLSRFCTNNSYSVGDFSPTAITIGDFSSMPVTQLVISHQRQLLSRSFLINKLLSRSFLTNDSYSVGGFSPTTVAVFSHLVLLVSVLGTWSRSAGAVRHSKCPSPVLQTHVHWTVLTSVFPAHTYTHGDAGIFTVLSSPETTPNDNKTEAEAASYMTVYILWGQDGQVNVCYHLYKISTVHFARSGWTGKCLLPPLQGLYCVFCEVRIDR